MHRDLFTEKDADLVHLVLARHHQQFVSLLKEGLTGREKDLLPFHDTGYHEITAEFMENTIEFLAEDSRILHRNMHPTGLAGIILRRFQGGQLLLGVNPEKGLSYDQDQNDADYADRIGDGIARR